MATPAQQPPQPSPQSLAIAAFLKSQDLKQRTCILSGQRKDLFRVKRALRALQSEAYQKARQKNPLLPAVENRAQAEEAFRQMPLNLLALRVSKIDPASASNGHGGHGHSHGGGGEGSKQKRIKGLWTVRIEQQQEISDNVYYTWFYEGPQWKRTAMAIGVFILLLGIVMFPLWPQTLRLGVWYLSVGALGLLGLFFLMSIFRLVLFCVTWLVVPPGLWLYPNLFEDVGFFDSFRPVWAWHKVKKSKQKKSKTTPAASSGDVSAREKAASESSPLSNEKSDSASSQNRDMRPTVEDE